MSDTEKMRRHEQLMLRMGDRNGADFLLAEQVGLVSPEEIFAATQSCTGCSAVLTSSPTKRTGSSTGGIFTWRSLPR